MIKLKNRYNLGPITGLVFLHTVALLAPFTFTWKALIAFFATYWIATGWGVCLCYHRLLTHRSFQCPKWLEYFLTVCGVLSCQGGAIHWVATHRYHHAASDTENDPHSPRRGFWWAHMLWFLKSSPVWDCDDFRARYAPELSKDPVHRVINHYEWAAPWALGFLLYFWGSWPCVIWGIFLRTIVTLHVTWLTNSAAHRWGYQSYATKDDSTNLWWVALLGFGEGWHNNHHAFQYSARHGLRWWEIDATYLLIRFLAFLGLAGAIRVPHPAIVSSMEIKDIPLPVNPSEETCFGESVAE